MTHAAVDDEVERITERDEHVDEESRHLARLGADQIDVHRVLNDEHYITSNHSYRDSKRPVLSAVFKKRFLSLRDSRHVLSVYVQESSPFFPRFQTCSFNCFRKTFLFLERFETTSSLTKKCSLSLRDFRHILSVASKKLFHSFRLSKHVLSAVFKKPFDSFQGSKCVLSVVFKKRFYSLRGSKQPVLLF